MAVKKKKLLFVNNLLVGGGVEKLMQDLVWALHERYDITVMTDTRCDTAAEILPEDVKYLYIESKNEPKEFLPRVVFKLVRKARKIWFAFRDKRQIYDIAIAIKDGWTVKRVSGVNAKKRYAWIHTDYNNNYYTNGVFGGPENELACMKRYEKIICVAEDIRKSIIDKVGDPGNLEVLYNPIDVKNVLEKGAESVVDIEPVPTPGVTRFVSVGRLNHQKGYDLLLEACYILEREGLPYELFIVGGEEPWGDEHDRLYRRQKKLGLKNVTFLGERNNPYKYMKCADWFISSSIFEGYSLVSQEAALLDVPLMLTDCSGVRELLGDSEYGIVMPISVLDIYHNMKRVIEHPELREHYKQKIMERKQIINYDERLSEIEKLFQ